MIVRTNLIVSCHVLDESRKDKASVPYHVTIRAFTVVTAVAPCMSRIIWTDCGGPNLPSSEPNVMSSHIATFLSREAAS